MCPEEDQTRDTVDSEPKHYQLSYSGPGLVVKVSTSRAEDPGFELRLRQDFSGLSHTTDLKMGTAVATLPSAWRYRVSDGTG